MRFKEKYRPQFHFSDEDGWINDPNGMIYYKGIYHLFFQNTAHDIQGNGDKMSWGHAISKDLLHWEILPNAILSTPEYAIWSGTCIYDKNNCSKLFDDENGGLIAFYTRKNIDDKLLQQAQCLAYSKDDGKTWVKYNNGNPIISFNDDPFNNRDFRDPKVLYVEKFSCYLMFVCGGKLRIYSSINLLDWNLESVDSSIDSECPDIFLLDVENSNEKRYLLSLGGRSYLLGDLIKENGKIKFVYNKNESYGIINFGPDSYASQSFANTNEIISMSWMSNWQYAHDLKKMYNNFCGAMTLPYKYSLIKENNNIVLLQKPIEQLKLLRNENSKRQNHLKVLQNKILSADIFELNLKIKVYPNQKFEIILKDIENSTLNIIFDYDNSCLIVDRKNQKNSINYFFTTNYPVHVDNINGYLELLLYVDKSSVEVIVNGGRQVGTFNVFKEGNFDVLLKSNIECNVDYLFYSLNSIY